MLINQVLNSSLQLIIDNIHLFAMQRHRHILTVVGLVKWCNVVSIQTLFYWTLGYMKAFSVMANHSKLLVCLIVPWPTIVLWSSNLLFSIYELNFVLVECKVVSNQLIFCHEEVLCFHNIVGCKPFSVCLYSIIHFFIFLCFLPSSCSYLRSFCSF